VGVSAVRSIDSIHRCATEDLERFVDDVHRGAVVRAVFGGVFLTLDIAYTELARRRTESM